MLAEGSCTLNPQKLPCRGAFTFWGEWEPPSEVSVLPQKAKGYPQWLHIPKLLLGTPPANGQNTDPLVFCDRFRYAICRQFNSNQRRTQLGLLNEGDVILFGSHIGGRFTLDTVFVVGSYSDWDKNGKLPDGESELHRKIAIEPFRKATTGCGQSFPSCGLRLYAGATWSSDMPFSFVPCLPSGTRPSGFPRPVIQPTGVLKSLISPKLKQNFRVSSVEDASEVWKVVVKQVLAQGCALGTAVDEPTR